jgi:hypothetical protein
VFTQNAVPSHHPQTQFLLFLWPLHKPSLLHKLLHSQLTKHFCRNTRLTTKQRQLLNLSPSLILKTTEGPEKDFNTNCTNSSFAFSYTFSFHVHLHLHCANTPKQGERYQAVIFHFLCNLKIKGFTTRIHPAKRTIRHPRLWCQNFLSRFYFEMTPPTLFLDPDS